MILINSGRDLFSNVLKYGVNHLILKTPFKFFVVTIFFYAIMENFCLWHMSYDINLWNTLPRIKSYFLLSPAD